MLWAQWWVDTDSPRHARGQPRQRYLDASRRVPPRRPPREITDQMELRTEAHEPASEAACYGKSLY